MRNLNIVENKTSYTQSELLSIAKRENNLKRNFLLVNLMQAKHTPVSPKKALYLFRLLAEELAESYRGKKVLVIGFAETATAIGAVAASAFPKDTVFLHTTREALQDEWKIVDFSEEHSHATEQKLYCRDWEGMAASVDQILFIEDEVTTGRTILNFVKALRETHRINERQGIAVASLVNAMKQDDLERFSDEGVHHHYLIRLKETEFSPWIAHIEGVKLSETPSKAFSMVGIPCNECGTVITFPGKLNPRAGVVWKEYENACALLSEKVLDHFGGNTFFQKKILVLGTEEFMYPALKVARCIEKCAEPAFVFTHSTTRSPILPHGSEGYPIKTRFALHSMYEPERNTFVYNLDTFDRVFVITDAENPSQIALSDLQSALESSGCQEIFFIRWVV